MVNPTLKPFDGQLDPVEPSALKPFAGTLDGEEPGLVARVKQGASRTIDSARTALTDDPNKIAQIASDQARTALPQTETQRKMAEEIAPYVDAANKAQGVVDNVKTWGAAGIKRAGQLLSSPGEAGKMIAEQLPNALPGMAGGIAGAKLGAMAGTAVAPGVGTLVGGVLGGVAGGFAGGYGLEKGAAMQEQVQKEAQAQQIDLQDQPAVAKMVALKQPEFDAAAQLKGVGTAGTDALLNVATMGLAGVGGRTLAKEARTLADAVKAGTISAADAGTTLAQLEAKNAARNTLGAKALRGTGVVGAEMAGEGLSEAAGQKLAYGKVDAGDVIDEALLGLGTGGAMALGSRAFNKAAGIVDQDGTTRDIAAARDGLGALGPAFTTEPGAADPNAPQAPIAEAPEAPDLTTTLGAGVPRDGLPFTRDVDTSGLAVEDRGALERARAAMVDYEPGDTTPQWDTQPGAAGVRGGLNMPAPEFDTGTLGLESRGRALTASERMGINPAAGPLSRVAAVAVDSGASPVQFLGATGRDLQARATGPGVTNESNVIDVQGRVIEDRAIATPRRLADDRGMATEAVGGPGNPPAAPAATPALPAPRNLRELQARVRAQKQEAADAKTAQAPAPVAAIASGPAATPALEAPRVSVPTNQSTTQGSTNGPQADQAQQAVPQPAQAGAAPAAEPATSVTQQAPAGTPEVRALTDGAPAANPGAQAAPAAGPQGQAAAPAPTRLGRNNTPLNEGGKPFKTRKAAGDAKKLQPTMRVVQVEGGFALADKTPAQLAAEERAAKRLRTARTSPKGEPVPAHAFIAASGGLHMRHRNDLGVDDNPRVGNRRLFGGLNKGLSIEQATEMLVADGYLSEGASHNDAYALIKKSLSQPQYNADGIERIAESDSTAMFEDYMAAQEEAMAEGDVDPFDMADEFTTEELDEVGFSTADPQLQAEVSALVAQADAMEIDTYAILEDIARTYADATQDQYNAAARDALAAAIARGNQDGGSAAAQAAPAPEPATKQGLNQPEAPANQAQAATENVAPEALELTALSPVEAAAQQSAQEQAAKAEAAAKRAEEAAAKAEEERKRIAQASVRAADTFELGQDPMDSLTGQGSIFDAPEPQAEVATDAQPDTPKLTPVEAKALMAWQDMGQANGVKTHALTFYESQADKDAKRGRMIVAKISKGDRSATAWTVEGDDQTFGMLSLAKKRGEEVGMARAVADGYVEQAAAVPSAPEKQAPTAPTATPIQDAGQKIGGARKDRWKERGLNLEDLDAMTESEGAELATKANVWKPDYEAMSEASEPVTAAMVKTIYDQLAAKPKKNTPEGRRQYVQMMRIVRDVLTEARGPEAVRNAYQAIRQRAGLNTLDPQAKTAARELLFSVYKGRSDPFVLGGADLMKAKRMVADGFPAKADPWKTRLVVGREEGGPGTTERGVEIYMERSAEVGTPLTREQILDGFYRVVTKDNKAVAFAASKADAEAAAATVYERDMKGKKDGKPEPVRPNLDELKRENLPRRIDRDVKADDFVNDLGFRGIEFGNWSAQDERQRILNMAYDGLMDLAEIMGVPPKAMSLNGTLGMAFGARGGGRFAAHYEPGKLVINMTKIRGGGSMAHEWAHAMDHYFGELDKPDAYTTQARGASGWYSEDQYLGVPRKRMEKVGNEWKNVEKMRLDNLRPEMAAAFDGVMRALFSKQITKAEMVRSHELDLERTEALARNEQQPDLKAMYQNMVQNKQQALNEMRGDPEGTMYAGRGRSDYASQAQKLSGKSTDGYWVRPTEMFARAFESWVFDRVTAMGAKSDYLVHGVEEDRFAGGAYKGNPYPTGEERARINAAFDKLASTVKTKKTDKGVAMFSRTAAGMSPEQAVAALNTESPVLSADQRSAQRRMSDERLVATQMLVDGLAKNWTRAPEIIVARNMEDLQIPQAVRDYDQTLKSQGASGEPRGFIYEGKVYLLADELNGPGQIAEVLFHEALGHFGLRGAFGDSLNSILQQVGTMRRKQVLAKAREYGMVSNGMNDADTWAAMSVQDRLSAAEEVLAEMAQSTPEIGFVQRAIAAIRTWLRANVPGFKQLALTDAEIIRSYILPARGFVTRSSETPQQSLERAMMAFSRGAGRFTSISVPRGTVSWLGFDGAVSLRADLQALANRHPEYYGSAADVERDIAFVMEKPDNWYIHDGGKVMLFREGTGNQIPQVRVELERSGADFVVRSVYVGDRRQIAKKMADKRKMLGGIGLGGQSLDSLSVADYLSAVGNRSSRPEPLPSSSPDTPVDGKAGEGDGQPVRFSRAPAATATPATGWDAPVKTGFDDVIYKLQDKNIDLKRVVEAITKSAGQVADSIDAYMKEELFHKRAAKRVADFGTQELRPLMNQMRMAGLSMDDVQEYLHARHAKEANAVIASRNPDSPGLQDGGSGMTNAAADNYFAKLDPAQRKKLEAVSKKVDNIIEGTRKLYVSYGLEDQAVVDGWAGMYQHYIPLMREDKEGGMGTGQGFSVKGKETKGRTGSTRKVVDILANIATQREKLIVRGEKNQVTQALVGLAQANPNPEFWEVRSQAPTERVFDPKKGVVVDRPDPLFKSRDNVIVAKVLDSKGNVAEQMVVFNEDNPRAVRMAAAMKNLDAGDLEGLLGVSAKITRYFAAINTQYNPVFGVVNLVRDVQGAMINLAATPLAGKQGKIARDTASALIGIYSDIRKTRRGGAATSKWAQLWEQMQDDGGTTGYREMFTNSTDRANDLKSILNPEGWMDNKWGKVFTANGALRVPMSMAQKGATEIFGWLSDYNEAMENGVRLATYKAALDQGMSRERAASLAKNLTVNFNRKGQVGQQAGAVYAFFNAAMQGTARLGQTLFDMDGGDFSTLRLSKTGKAVVYGGVLLGVMQALALAGAGFDDEDPPEFVRERSLIIPTGNKTYVSIPMPLGLHVIPGLGRQATEFALSGFDKPAKRALSVVGMFADAFNPIGNAGLSMQTLAPTALDPLVALTENKDWTGKPIARVSSNQALPGHTQWKDTATAPAKMLAEAINWVSGGNEYVAGALSPTPDQIDYLLAQLGGGVAREAAKVQQTVSSVVSGEELPTYKVPLLGRFAGNTASQASQGTAFYANLDKLNALETEIKGLRKDGKFLEAAQLARENPQSGLIALANRAERDVQKLRRDKRELIATGATREQVRAKEEQITAVMMRLNEAAERRKAAATG